VITLRDVHQLDTQLQAQGRTISANLIVLHLHGSKRDALALLRRYRAEPPVPAPVPAPAPELDPAPSERPLVLCQRCGYAAWFEWTIGDWRCHLCGSAPPP
jgi:hypothetical protein